MSNSHSGSSTDRGYIALNGKKNKKDNKQSILKQKSQSEIDSIRQRLFDKPIQYPTPPAEGGVTDVINGVTVQDTWRALENAESEETKRFIEEQNECSFPFLHSDVRKPLEDAVHETFNYSRNSCPTLQGDDNYYWLFNPGEASRDIMVRSSKDKIESSFGKSPLDKDGPELFFDPSTLPNTSLYNYSWSSNGRYFCAILQESGSDWQSIRTIDCKTCEYVDQTLVKSKFTFGACWIKDYGFIYKRLLKTLLYSDDEDQDDADGQFGLFYHQLNTSQQDDINIWQGTGSEAKSLIVGRPFLCATESTENVKGFLFIDIYRNTNPECEAFLIELDLERAIEPKELQRLCFNDKRWISRGFQGDSTYIGTLPDNRILFLSTTDGCSTGRIISISADSIQKTSSEGQLPIQVLVPPHKEGHILQKAHLVGDDLLVLIYLRHVCTFVIYADAKTGLPLGWSTSKITGGRTTVDDASDDKHEPVLPQYSSISSISSRSNSDDFFMSVETWTEPPFILRGWYESETKKVHLDRMMKDNNHDQKDDDDVICKQVFYPSHDGVQIPMFLCFNRSLDLTKPNRTLLHAYGGFAVPNLPHYEPWFMAFVRQLNGILAVAGIRGGGEYGKSWHEEGMGKKRINAFNDFAFAAHYLHSNKLSKPSLTATYGTSNGGTLIMANVNRNPELFQACMADVGVSDLIRFPLFTIGRVWQAEYGSPQDPKMTNWLKSVSPLHNVDPDQDVHLPALLITTGDHDTRVVPAHSLKHLAEVQTQKQKNKNPILGRIYIGAGHEAGSKSTKERVAEAVDRLVFCLLSLKE